MRTYVKTDKLGDVTYRGQKALVVAALASFDSSQSAEEIEKVANDRGQYTKLLNPWARENGGVHSSVLYHLRELEKLGLVKVVGEVDRMQLSKKPAKKAAKRRVKKVPAPTVEEVPPPVEAAS